MVQIYKNEVVVFDLDDLLFKEFDFIRSAYWDIAKKVDNQNSKMVFKSMMVQYWDNKPVMDWLSSKYEEYSVETLLTLYRNHEPEICLTRYVLNILNRLKENGNIIGLITDGRAITQRNKIKALGLEEWISDFIISEEFGFSKPSPNAFEFYIHKYPGKKFIYIADNYNKDFLSPNNLGWRTVALNDNGLNIHQKKEDIGGEYIPIETINNFKEIQVMASVLKNSKTENF